MASIDWPQVDEELGTEIRSAWADFQAENALHPCEPPPSFIEGFRRARERPRATDKEFPTSERAVIEQIRQRARVGLEKYGVSTDRTDLTTVEWLRHLQEELLDGAVYVERSIRQLRGARARQGGAGEEGEGPQGHRGAP